MKTLRVFIPLLLLALAQMPARACAVCFGTSDAATRDGITSAIYFLLLLILLVMGAIAAFFIHLKRFAAQSALAEADSASTANSGEKL
jgi:hypothetical protein